MEGKIFSKAIDQDELSAHKVQFMVISTQLKMGRLHIRVFSEFDPGNGFIPAAPNLEDVYFSNIASRTDVSSI